ncbi:MAG TPA: response regulator [Nitrososphaeraceae archaeon]|jgi:CheY-like chemotaxis protein
MTGNDSQHDSFDEGFSRSYEKDSSPIIETSDEISFFDLSQNYCVCFVDVSESTKTTATIKDSQKIRDYYSTFLNSMAAIISEFHGRIIKSTGDGILYYFPSTSNVEDDSGFSDVLECGLTMIAVRSVISAKLAGIVSSMSYRVSADYGRVEVARSAGNPDRDDLFGSTVNLCTKINSKASPNEMVIGGDLYQVLKNPSYSSLYSMYKFKGKTEYCLDAKHPYPVYTVARKESINSDGVIRRYDKLFDTLNLKKHLLQSATHSTNIIHQSKSTRYVDHEIGQKKSSYNVLIVDDEPDVLLTYRSFLEDAGYNVEAFSEPQESLKKFAEHATSYYDLVILDIRMPGVNGLQLYSRMKAIDPEIKIIFLSALDAAEELLSILPGTRNNDTFIRKPVDLRMFINTVKTVLN